MVKSSEHKIDLPVSLKYNELYDIIYVTDTPEKKYYGLHELIYTISVWYKSIYINHISIHRLQA